MTLSLENVYINQAYKLNCAQLQATSTDVSLGHIEG
jgi:hypothetical protein